MLYQKANDGCRYYLWKPTMAVSAGTIGISYHNYSPCPESCAICLSLLLPSRELKSVPGSFCTTTWPGAVSLSSLKNTIAVENGFYCINKLCILNWIFDWEKETFTCKYLSQDWLKLKFCNLGSAEMQNCAKFAVKV